MLNVCGARAKTAMLVGSGCSCAFCGGCVGKCSDELPQLWSVMKGYMSLVGPRPALYNQDDLIALRAEKGIRKIIPGITGWAQVNGRDDLPIPIKVGYDEYYLKNRSFLFDIKILFLTLFTTVKSEGVQH